MKAKKQKSLTKLTTPGLPEATPIISSAHQDAHLRLAGCLARTPRLLASPRPKQARSLLQLANYQDGSIRCLRQCAHWPLTHLSVAANIREPHQPPREDPADSGQQSDRKPPHIALGAFTDKYTDFPNPKHHLPGLHGGHRRRAHLAPDPRHDPRRLHARHARQLDHQPVRACVCADVPAGADLGAILQHCRLRHRHVHQHAHQKEEVGSLEEEGELIAPFETMTPRPG